MKRLERTIPALDRVPMNRPSTECVVDDSDSSSRSLGVDRDVGGGTDELRAFVRWQGDWVYAPFVSLRM